MSDAATMIAVPHVLFHLGRQMFALPLAQVKDVAKHPTITAVPQADAHVAGLTVLRDQLACVLDLRTRFGVPAATQSATPTALVVEHDGERVALLVDRIDDVLSLATGPVPAPSSDPLWQGVIAGLVTRDDTAIVVLDVGGIVAG